MSKLITALLASVVLFSTAAHADISVKAREHLDLSRIPYQHIANFESKKGETLDAFMLRVGPALRKFTDRHHWEACGVIGKSKEGRFGVVLGSSHSHIACITYPNKVLKGMTSTGMTIHSHSPGEYLVNHITRIFLPNLPNGVRYLGGGDEFHFSVTDFNGGPGYLATPKGVIFQDGARHVRTVGHYHAHR